MFALFAALAMAAPVWAQAPASAQGTVAAALGAPAQPKVSAPPPAATVKAGEGGGASAPPASTVADALAAHDIQRALDLGATAQELAAWLVDPDTCPAPPSGALPCQLFPRLHLPGIPQLLPSSAQFIRQGSLLAVMMADEAGNYNLVGLNRITYPGDFDSLPTEIPPSPAEMAAGQTFNSGGSAADAVRTLAASFYGQIPDIDLSTAHWIQVRTDDGHDEIGVGVVMRDGDGTTVQTLGIRGTGTYPGRAALPTLNQAFPQFAPPPDAPPQTPTP